MPEQESDLSNEQKVLLYDFIRVVDAGPGSGKTRALTARFQATARDSNKGVALVSFTNAAVKEVRRRTGRYPELLRAPHFVGTIDSFLHRFIVSPAETARLGRPPSYWASWDDLPGVWSVVRLANPSGSGIRLSRFRVDQAGAILLNKAELDWEERAYLSQVHGLNRQGALMSKARAVINGLTRAGTFDASTARLKADQLLSGQGAANIVSRISGRFSDLLIDEAQDCDEAEYDIIRRIADAGVNTVVVADPDQAIYEFRGSSPRLFLAYRDAQPPTARARLTINYRSTRSICAAVTALRSDGAVTANDSSDCAPVFILSGDPDDQRIKFLAILDEHQVSIESAIVLAHRRVDAQRVAGSVSPEPTSGAAGNQLAVASSVIQLSDKPSERLAAVETIQRTILNLVDWPPELRTRSHTEQLRALNRGMEWLRQAVAAFVAKASMAQNEGEFGATARQILGEILQPLPIPLLSLSQRVRKPTASVWTTCVGMSETTAWRSLASSTIHGAKGMEFDAVLLVLPSTLREINGLNVLDEWEQDRDLEARRVLYVGASRAKKVLAFGAGSHAERIARILNTRDVPIESR